MRIHLAAIDHNFHLFRKSKQSPEGDLVGHREYSKWTQRYHAEIVKEERGYAYFPFMVSRMLDAPEDLKKVSQLGQMLTSSTLAMKAQPSTEDLMKAPSRFLLKPKDNENMDKWPWNRKLQTFCQLVSIVTLILSYVHIWCSVRFQNSRLCLMIQNLRALFFCISYHFEMIT